MVGSTHGPLRFFAGASSPILVTRLVVLLVLVLSHHVVALYWLERTVLTPLDLPHNRPVLGYGHYSRGSIMAEMEKKTDASSQQRSQRLARTHDLLHHPSPARRAKGTSLSFSVKGYQRLREEQKKNPFLPLGIIAGQRNPIYPIYGTAPLKVWLGFISIKATNPHRKVTRAFLTLYG
ncbi:unnamed protein product [Zymoseptoria tritici ST99CH_1E4]|uniref:Uncharacterized protein n=1 Tax=Zymoseptoria tritici ST99CH_1E4 TaxID=1276532 RepID=A0A2H1H3Z8_ZYMTR|nr:unnamed protein product [Zymoseptoria tritici ST99CH_1E4]